MYSAFDISKKTLDYVSTFENKLKDDFNAIDQTCEYNQLKVLKSFIDNKLSESHFTKSTGYAYSDLGRDIIDSIFKDVFNTEDALVRQQFVSGTHAISLVLFALCRPGDHILSISGLPYDTLHTTLGIVKSESSITNIGVSFNYVDLDENDDFDYELINKNILNNTRIIMIQRSRGYSGRKALSVEAIKNVIKHIKNINKNIIVFIDNCYGEFVEKIEPSDVGADILCGSLIKNPGGGLAETGAYIVGKSDIINLCADRLTAPGVGKEVGVNFGQNRNVLQGLYMAPFIVSNSLKLSRLYAIVLNELGIDTVPRYNEKLNDIVLAIKFNNREKLIDFCNIIQSTSPVDSFLKPVSTPMPGYNNDIIMAAGCFISGSSIELSCDAPIREPYYAFMQGGLSYYQGKLALMKALEKLDLIK